MRPHIHQEQRPDGIIGANHARSVLQHPAHPGTARLHCIKRTQAFKLRSRPSNHGSVRSAPRLRRSKDRGFLNPIPKPSPGHEPK